MAKAFGGTSTLSRDGEAYNAGDTETMGGSDIVLKAIWNPVSSGNNTGMIVNIRVRPSSFHLFEKHDRDSFPVNLMTTMLYA